MVANSTAVILGKSKICSGSILNDRWVLTAARCETEQGFKVIRSNVLSFHILADSYVARVVNHSKYEVFPITHDIALIEVTPPLRNIQAIPLLGKSSNFDMVPGLEAGYGECERDDLRSNTRCLSVKQCSLFPCQLCGCFKGFANSFNANLLKLFMICSMGTVTSCPGDSGGPLVTVTYGQVQVRTWYTLDL